MKNHFAIICIGSLLILHVGRIALSASSMARFRTAAVTSASTSVCGNFQSQFFMPGAGFSTSNLCSPEDLVKGCDPTDPNNRTIWHTAAGWAYKDNEKFFPVGLWMSAIRGIDQAWKNTGVITNNRNLIRSTAEQFDVFHQERRFLQSYMKPGINPNQYFHLSMGTHHAISRTTKLGDCGLEGLDFYKNLDIDDNELFDKDKRAINFTEMMNWRRNIECALDREFYLNHFRDLVVPEIWCKTRALGINNNDFIWYLADEPDQAWAKADELNTYNAKHQKGWSLHPDLLQLYQDAIKAEVPNALTFVSLGGNLRGHVYTYEHLYNTANTPDSLHHAGTELPTGSNLLTLKRNPPDLEGDPRDYDSYRYSYAGAPLQRYKDSNDDWGTISPITTADTAGFYDNIYHIAQGYCSTGDVLGLNAFGHFRLFPHWAGRTVDTIKDACGDDKPVWLHFDAVWNQSAVGYTADDYIKDVRGQVFTSIAHGATGIWFFGNDNTVNNKPSNEVPAGEADAFWDTLTGLAQELQNLKPVLKGEILSQGVQNIHLHYTVRQPTGGDPHLIVTNTDLVNSQTFADTLGLFGPYTLAPLEVISTDQQTGGVATWSGTLSQSTTWSGLNRIIGDVTVATGVTLTIDAGATLQVEGDYEIKTLGTLQVNGSQGAPVRARFHTANPNSGDWKGFRIEGTANLNHIEIDHADYGLLVDGFATATLDHVTLRECTTGLMVDNQTPTVSNSRFENNGLGLDAFGANTQVDIDHTLFVGNTNAIHARNNAQVNVTTTTIDNTTNKGVESSIYADVDLAHTAVTGSVSTGLATDTNGTLSLAHSNIYSDTGTHYLFVTDPLGANGNLSTPPHYFNTTLILNEPSLLIDAGDPTAATGSEPGGPARLDIGRHAGTHDASAPIEDALQDGDFELGTAWWENAWSDRNTGTVTVWQRRSDNRPGKTGTHYYTTCDDDNCTTAQPHRGVLRSHRFKIKVVNDNKHLASGVNPINRSRTHV